MAADPALEAYRRRLEAMRDACSHRPVLHQHQLAALDREIALVGAAGDPAAYMSASGELFELTRAASLDRAANQARVAAAVGDRRRVHAAAVEYEHALAATGHGDWNACVTAGNVGAADHSTRSAEAGTAYGTVLLALLSLQSGLDEGEMLAARETAAGAHAALRTADPGFGWSRVARDPLYDLRTPWTGPARATVGGWLVELGVPDEVAETQEEPGDPLAAIEAAGARWRSSLAAGPAGAPAPPGDAPADPAAAEAAAALREQAEERLERRSIWPDPLVEHHWRSLISALDDVSTPTEVELVSAHADACFAIEGDWNAALLATLLEPLRAACTFGAMLDGRLRAGVGRAAEAAHSLIGLGPRSLLDVPRVTHFVERILFPLGRRDPGALSAAAGEAGFEPVLAARAWFDAVRARGEEEPRDPGELRAALLGLLDEAGAPEPPALPRPVTLWGVEIDLADLMTALAAPARPPVPGMLPGRAAGAGL